LLATVALVYGQPSVEPRVRPAPKQEERIRPDIRVDTTLVLVPVQVTDGLGRPVTGLEQQDFRVVDDKIPQTITSFAMEDGPIAVGVVFDRSGSMATGIPLSRRTVAEFFKSANPEDEFFLVEFAGSPKLIIPLASDNTGDIQNHVGYSKPQGSTAMFDAVYMALNEIKKSKKQRKALLLITDGGDNNSRYTESEVKNAIRESDVMIYTIGVGADYNEERMLAGLSEKTGGRYFTAGFQDLPDIAQKVGIDLRNRYILGYVPTNRDRDGRFHRVEVRVVPPAGLPPLKAFWRRGYYAPME
jgi:Ca-activated chloride channel family protein